MTTWTRAVVLPVAIAIPLLGIVTDVVTPLLLDGRGVAAPWRNPSAAVWCVCGVLIPLILLLEQRWPLRRPVPAAVRRERFAQALDRARETLQTGRAEWRERAVALVGDEKPQRVNRIVLRTRNRILLIAAEAIDWIEADGNYARVHIGGEAHLIRETMSTIEERLDPAVFVRTHRRAIVNVERIREVMAVARGEYQLILKDGKTRVPLSRGC